MFPQRTEMKGQRPIISQIHQNVCLVNPKQWPCLLTEEIQCELKCQCCKTAPHPGETLFKLHALAT